MKGLANKLAREGALKSPEVIEAFLKIDRANFVKPEYVEYAHEDIPLPIGHGQTISQPLTVAIMLELLEVEPGDKVLDVGAGSGWTTALLGAIVGKNGKVFGIERIPELVKFGQENIEKYPDLNATINLADATELGLSEEAPFEKILVSATATDFPEDLLEQLKIGGQMVIPIQYSLWQIRRVSKNGYDKKEFPGFVFVPLIY